MRQSRRMAFCSRSVKLKRLRAATHRLQILLPIERTRRSHAENESGVEPTKTTSGEAVNQALTSKIGSKPKRRFAAQRKLSTKTDFFTACHSPRHAHYCKRISPRCPAQMGSSHVAGFYAANVADP